MQPYLWFVLGVAATGFALFSALTHNALRSFSRARLREALERKGRLAQLPRLSKHHHDLLQMTRLLHLVGVVALVVLAEVWATGRFGTGAGGWLIGGAVAAIVGVVATGIIPLAWAGCAAESVLATVLPVCHLCRAILTPVLAASRVVDGLVRRLAGVPKDAAPGSDIEREIVSVADAGEREGAIEENQVDMIENVLKFRRADASQIMTPRTDIVSLDAHESVEAARRLIAESGYSRIPATRDNLDTIVGILYAKDLLDHASGEKAEHLTVEDVMRRALFVPETKSLDELLREFQANKVHMAVVLDEYGGTSGLVTIEDILEEIVGEIVDEYEPEPPKSIRRVGERVFEVEARVHIDELNDELEARLPEGDDYETVGGFVLSQLGYIPKAGESLEHNELRITILEAEERRITRLRIELAAAKAE